MHQWTRFTVRAGFLSVAWSKLRLCLANHRADYFSNMACDWLSIVWVYFEQETENGPWLLTCHLFGAKQFTWTKADLSNFASLGAKFCEIWYKLYTVEPVWWDWGSLTKKHINFLIYLVQSLQNHVFPSCHERPPALRDHISVVT